MADREPRDTPETVEHAKSIIRKVEAMENKKPRSIFRKFKKQRKQ